MSRLAVLAAGGLVVGALVAPGHATPPPGPTSCRASVLRVDVAGSTVLEPVVANDPGSPCATDNSTLVEITSADTGGLLDLTLLKAKTTAPPPGPANGPHPASAEAGVAELQLHLGTINASLPEVVVEGAQSRVGFSCTGSTLTNPTFSGSSHVLLISASGIGSLEVPQDLGIPQTIEIPGVLKIVFNEVISTPTSMTRRAIHVTVFDPTGSITDPEPIADVVVAESSLSFPAGGSSTACPPPPPPPPSGAVGWMNGGGKLDGGITHSLGLPCTLTQDHPKARLHVDSGAGAFELTSLTQVSCSMVAGNGDPEQPDAGFNTLSGRGVGTCGKASDVPASFTFTDGGEPNKGNDKATIDIDPTNSHGCRLHATGTVNGNQQAHRG